MNINEFINNLDKLFEEKRINDVEPFLNESLAQAVSENDVSAQFTILNEMMGFFRDTSQYDKSIKACHQCIDLMKRMEIEGTVDYATSLQNIANAHRAAGLLKESLDFYNQAFKIYENNIPSNDYRFASLNNNIALLYQEMGNYENAVRHLKMALEIITKIEGADIQISVTHSNLGASLIELNQVDEAIEHLNTALEIFRRDEVKDFHYSAALSAMAAAKCKKGDYTSAAKLYEETLEEIEINMGKGTAYKITEENLRKVYEKLGREKDFNTKQGVKTDLNLQKEFSQEQKAKSDCALQKTVTGIELSRKFYEQYGAKMIQEKFPEYENKIAVGLVGEGSERFGFDDEYSKDHDFGPGFCMWVTKSTYEEIGEKLQEEYEKLPEEFMGVKAYRTKMAKGRCGVCKIGDFFQKYTGYEQPPKTVGEWVEIEDYKLATVTNGEIFKDDEGKFSKIRNSFANIPETVKYVKIAREIAGMAQTGQSNYGRAMARKDYVTASICITEFMKHTMKAVYLLNGKYAPYYKWMLKGMNKLSILPEVGDILRALADMPDQREKWEGYEYSNLEPNKNDMKAMTVEIVAKLIIAELKNQKILDEEIPSNFLNDYSVMIMRKLEGK